MSSPVSASLRRLEKSSFKEQLSSCLPAAVVSQVRSSLEIIGSIAVLKLHNIGPEEKKDIARLVLRFFPRVKTVLNQASPVEEEFRLRKFELIAGEDTREAVHRESGCVFKVDLANVYFSPRLQHERLRIAKHVKPGEVLVNMFAGIGSFSIIAARHSSPRKVYSIDLNPRAVELGRENIRLNKMEDIVEFMEGDAKSIIEEELMGVADRVLMPLPMRAFEYLPAAASALRDRRGIIHYYDFVHRRPDRSYLLEIGGKITEKLLELHLDSSISEQRIVRAVGPNWEQVALDIDVKPQS